MGRLVFHDTLPRFRGVAEEPAGAVGGTTDDLLLPQRTALFIGGLRMAAVATSVFLFLVPTAAIAIWPWTLTALTARVMGAIFALGVAGLGAFTDKRWTSMRILLQVAGVMLVLILLAAVRAHGDFRHDQTADLGVRRRFPGARRSDGRRNSLYQDGTGSPRQAVRRCPEDRAPEVKGSCGFRCFRRSGGGFPTAPLGCLPATVGAMAGCAHIHARSRRCRPSWSCV